jgi:hypothetical protein
MNLDSQHRLIIGPGWDSHLPADHSCDTQGLRKREKLYSNYFVILTRLKISQVWGRRGGVLESPPNGPDIFDVFRLSRHLSNFLTKRAPVDFLWEF